MNLHLSEVVSEVAEALANDCADTKEVISTEDLIARMYELNEKKRGWNEFSWWHGRETEDGRFRSCMKCVGKTEVADREYVEVCMLG